METKLFRRCAESGSNSDTHVHSTKHFKSEQLYLVYATLIKKCHYEAEFKKYIHTCTSRSLGIAHQTRLQKNKYADVLIMGGLI